jgi:DNA anti-recombination protein RmuC
VLGAASAVATKLRRAPASNKIGKAQHGANRQADHEVSDMQDSSKTWVSSTAEKAQETATAATDHIKEQARDLAEQQKRAGAEQIGGVAHAMEAAANELQGQMPMAAEYIEDVAGRLGEMASALRERSIDDMLGNVADFARKQPAVFFTGAMAAGFALSRFAKSSANRGR